VVSIVRKREAVVVRAVVVDDHPGFRAAAGRLLTASGLELVGTAGDLAEARTLIGGLNPDFVLLDVQLPDGNGFDLADQLASSEPSDRPMIVMTSSRSQGEYRARLERSGVAGFVSKDELSVDRLRALMGAT
jgi:DNA-binding NarL/FixJ family response regulator